MVMYMCMLSMLSGRLEGSREDIRHPNTLPAPASGFVGLATVLCLVSRNLTVMTDSSSFLVSLFPFFVLGVWGAGAASALWIRSNRPALLCRLMSCEG